MKVTNKYDLPKPIYEIVNSDYKYKQDQYSATTLLSGVKNIILSRRHTDEIEQDVSDMGNLILGLAFHKLAEDSQEEKHELKEGYLVKEVYKQYKLSGRFDLYNELKEMLTDYKTTSVYKYIFQEYDDWLKQLSIYAYLMELSGFKVTKAQIIPLYKDWSAGKYKEAMMKGNRYPKSMIEPIIFNITEKEINAGKDFVINRLMKIEEYEKLNDDDIPECSKEERWTRDEKWAVKKEGNKRATLTFQNEIDALDYVIKNPGFIVEYRPGIDQKCEEYCNCNQFCSYYKKMKERELNETI